MYYSTFYQPICIDYVNRTVSGNQVDRKSRLRPSGQQVWPPLHFSAKNAGPPESGGMAGALPTWPFNRMPQQSHK